MKAARISMTSRAMSRTLTGMAFRTARRRWEPERAAIGIVDRAAVVEAAVVDAVVVAVADRVVAVVVAADRAAVVVADRGGKSEPQISQIEKGRE